MLGDIVLTCTNYAPASGGNFQKQATTSLSVSLAGLNITNNIDFGAGAAVTDAVVIVNENHSTSPTPTPTFSGADSRFQGPQFGTLAAPNRIEWTGLQIPVPGAPNDGTGIETGAECDHFEDAPGGCFPTHTTIRITSLRGNASQLGIPGSATFPSTQVTAFVSINGEIVPPISNNVLNVGVPLLGLVSDVTAPPTALQCDDTQKTVSIHVDEGFATAFKTEGSASPYPGNSVDNSGAQCARLQRSATAPVVPTACRRASATFPRASRSGRRNMFRRQPGRPRSGGWVWPWWMAPTPTGPAERCSPARGWWTSTLPMARVSRCMKCLARIRVPSRASTSTCRSPGRAIVLLRRGSARLRSRLLH